MFYKFVLFFDYRPTGVFILIFITFTFSYQVFILNILLVLLLRNFITSGAETFLNRMFHEKILQNLCHKLSQIAR